MPSGDLLLAFADAVLASDDQAVTRARDALYDSMGGRALVDAAATVASYNATVKVADATGIPLDAETAEETAELRADLGLMP